jgi:ABC-type branched-subunit amino acid transport system substrate-binding protein
MIRMRIPQMLNDRDEFNVTPKADDDQMMGRSNDLNEDAKTKAMNGLKRLGKPLQVNIDWSLYTKNYESVAREALQANISGILLQAKSQVNPDVVKQYADNSGRDNFIKTVTLQIMSTPEYQLC